MIGLSNASVRTFIGGECLFGCAVQDQTTGVEPNGSIARLPYPIEVVCHHHDRACLICVVDTTVGLEEQTKNEKIDTDREHRIEVPEVAENGGDLPALQFVRCDVSEVAAPCAEISKMRPQLLDLVGVAHTSGRFGNRPR